MAPDKLGKKSRKEKRKEARVAKKQKKFDSWIHHQQSEKLNKPSRDSKQKNISKLKNDGHFSEQRKVVPTDVNNRNSYSLVEPSELKNFEEELDGLGDLETCGLKSRKTRRHSCRSSKTKFEEYLEMDLQQAGVSAEEDMKLESKLAKKLKVKDGKLGADDALDSILEVSPSVFDTLKGESNPRAEEDASRKGFENGPSSKNHRKSKSNKVKVDGQIDDEGAYDVGVQLVASCEECEMSETSKIELVSSKDPNSVPVKAAKRKKTKFEEYLEMSLQEGIVSAKEDLGLERKLAKKLRVKEGKLKGDYDEFNMLLEGIPSVLDSLEDEGISAAEEALTDVLQKKKLCRKQKKMRLEKQEQDMKMACENDVGKLKSMETSGTEVISDKVPTKSPMSGANTMYVAPHLRSRVENESEEHSRFRKMVRGLLNRLSESNLEKITGEISTMFHSVGRNAGTQIISELVLVSCSGGPRGNKQYAAVFAAFVAGMASSVGIDFGAKIIASLAKSFEDEHLEEDNLSLRNLTLLLSYLYILGVCSSDLIYDFLIMLSKRLTEIDVSIILTVLECAGMKLRGDDPIAMKNFVLNVQSGVNELKATSANDDAKHSKRMEFMLETICDIKNNKRRSDDDTVHLTQIKKWLQKLGVDNILIRGLKWAKLLDPNKKGQWWLSGDMASATENIEEVASKIDREVPETQKMLQLAAAQRMTTDARKAIFCIIMSGEDYIDAFEKLLRLELPGKQDREIMRVLVDCCLQEKVFNKYYCVLASKLCSHDKNHKFTLQYCLWDHFKELDSMVLMRSMHLAKFVAEMLASFSLSLAVLKVVDLGDPTQLTPKRIMHFRILFEAIFEYSDTLVWNIFTRIALTPEYETLRSSIEFFIKNYVVSSQNSLVNKFKVAKKALNNVEGVIW